MSLHDEKTEVKYSVLFLCLGNICRSPMAEAIFRKMVSDAGLQTKIKIDSAGTGDWHVGASPHQGTRKILDQYHIDYSDLRARTIETIDFQRFDVIVCMDEDNLRNAKSLIQSSQQCELRLMLDYVPHSKFASVPDPYFTGDFQQTFDLLNEACSHLLNNIREKLKI